MKILLVLFLAAAATATQPIDYSKVEPMLNLRPELQQNLLTPFNLETRIAGGQEAESKQFPHQVAILIHVSETQNGICGGSLISPNFVLTAAHCLPDEAKYFTIVLGGNKPYDEKEPGQVRIQTTDRIVHPNFNPRTLRFDIGLIKLPKAVTLNDGIQTIRLPKKSQVSATFENEVATISGWGKAGDKTEVIGDLLRFTKNKILSNRVCNRRLRGIVQPSQICLSGEGGHSTCLGDSGSPLIVVDKDNQLTQIGLTSFGNGGGCELGFPTVFTRLTSYLDWIERHSDVKLEK